ncbi:hypothetical protein LR48_Vigan09g125700 [Vigna angularis]|uniref:Uncharacterized protein n=1 Tax=Phaseolus angularis TaxID=3914 RepID=A0A0L9VC67_PHAAN|nr:hypothetical protein LR48_Vigan09g125700 [Vigna angularis]
MLVVMERIIKQSPSRGAVSLLWCSAWSGAVYDDLTSANDDSTSVDDEIREVSEDDEIEEILNEPLLEGEYDNESTIYKGKLFNNECF